MKKITIRDITIEFEETLDLEITEDKIVVKGKTPTSYPVYIPSYYPVQQPTYPANPWITWTLPNYVPNTGVIYQSDPNWLGNQPRTLEIDPLYNYYSGSNLQSSIDQCHLQMQNLHSNPIEFTHNQ